MGELEEQRGEPGPPGDSTGRQGSVRERPPTRCHREHRQLSGAPGRKGAHDEALPRPAHQLCAALPGGAGLAALDGLSPAPWPGRAMPRGSSRKGALCCHAASTAEAAQGGPGAGQGPAWVPGRSPFQNLGTGTLRLSTDACPAPGRCRNLSQGLRRVRQALRFSDVPSAFRKGAHSPCAQPRDRGREQHRSWHLRPPCGRPH